MKTINVPLYYTGLNEKAWVSHKGGRPTSYELARDYSIELPVSIPAEEITWYVVR